VFAVVRLIWVSGLKAAAVCARLRASRAVDGRKLTRRLPPIRAGRQTGAGVVMVNAERWKLAGLVVSDALWALHLRWSCCSVGEAPLDQGRFGIPRFAHGWDVAAPGEVAAPCVS